MATFLTLNFFGYVATFVAGGFFFTKVWTWIKNWLAAKEADIKAKL